MKPRIKHISILLLLGAAALFLWRLLDHKLDWQEEVELSDGRKITIEQKRIYFENHGTTESWVKFSLPEMQGENTWHSYLTPMRIDVDNGQVYVFGRPRGPKQVAYYLYPKVCIVAFAWRNAGFERVPLSAVPMRLLQEENVYPCVPKHRGGTLTIVEKKQQWCPPAGDGSLLVKRIDLKAYANACDSMASLDGATRRSD